MFDRIRRGGQVAWAVLGLAALIVVIGLLAWFVRVIFPPLVFAGAIVFILNPVVTFLQRRHIPRAAGTGLAYLGVAGILVILGLLLTPMVSRQSKQLSDEWPELRQQVDSWVNDVAERSRSNEWIIQVPSVKEIEKSFRSDANASLADRFTQVREIGQQLFHIALILLLSPIIAFYLLVDLPHIRRVSESLVPERAHEEVLHVARRLNRAIGGYFRGQLVVAGIVGAMVSVALAILDLPFWLIVGFIAGVFNMIPLIGPWVGAVPGVIIALTTRDFGTALWVIAIMAGAQQIDNHFITPNVMQRVVKLHPAVVMLALLAGGTIGGFLGLLLAVPITATLKIIVGHLWHTYVLGEPFAEIKADDDAEDAAPDNPPDEVRLPAAPAAVDPERVPEPAPEPVSAPR